MASLIDKGFDRMLYRGNEENYWYKKIMKKIQEGKGAPWLGDSWRQYLTWFSTQELLLTDKSIAEVMLKNAEQNWLILDDANILMEESRNNGSWIRPWRIALTDI